MNSVLSPADYRQIVEQAPVMIWRAGTDARCDYFNERWLSFTGRTMSQEVGGGWTESVHPEDIERCLRTFLDAFERREFFEMQYRLRRHDGVYRWIVDRGGPVKSERDEFAGYVGSCVDITDRVEAQEMIARERMIELTLLRGLLPICSWCKRVRNEDGTWSRLDIYLHDHSNAKFTHGICPDCGRLHGPSDPIPA